MSTDLAISGPAAPRFATPAPSTPTMGPAISKTMMLLGDTPMPWQDHAADVVGELREDGLPRWPMVIVSVPRQAGKSRFAMATAVHKILTVPGARVWYTAQSGADAADQWRENLDKLITSPIAGAFQWRRANGSQVLIAKNTGGRFSPHPPSEEKLHGKQSDLNIIDEAWAFDEAEAAALMQAIVPTQATRPGAQVIIMSTMGTAKSSWFHGLVDRARAGDSGIALLDWGIEPGVDASDLSEIARAHPAYGLTVDMAAIEGAAAQFGAGSAEFARAYGNRATGSTEQLIPAEAWQAVQSDEKIPVDAAVSLGAAISIDRSEGAIAACWIDDQRRPWIEIIDVRNGTEWLADRLHQLGENHDIAAAAVDSVGPSGALASRLERESTPGDGLPLTPVKMRGLTNASTDLYDRIMSGRINVAPDRALDRAIEIVARRNLGDSWTWSRRGSSGSIAPLEAATLALHAATHKKEPAPAPNIRF